MTSRNRETLRNYFGDGKLPTRQHFGDLIDSMLNMSDEGFRKTAENGVEVSTPVGHEALISFYQDQRPKSAVWSIGYGGGQGMLHVQAGGVAATRSNPPVLALDKQARVGINTATPQHTLDVAGTVGSRGRRGTYQREHPVPVLADGEWHDLTDPLSGCQAFEVMAGSGAPGQGRFALMHAIALNTYNPTTGWFDIFSRKKRITPTHAHYGRRCDKMQLRWSGSSGKNASYRLQIRTGCDYGNTSDGSKVRIKVFLTQLWFDETTQGPEA
ncbi:hypothetical protein HZU83_19960 [Sphaerotilus montanus]|uniref:Uncharacterized protein n=1 Tax=Sphaerotilus montanus TaxID=522889 RepID=A0A7Y9UE78_9BURK|nr:hypothetical protein [Sphaerotilus montanus]NYG35399.1 hypothetical protein [Sphaerotilus montanus]NZD58959.1 hypothetical protein [Sphaerotilus montanus]